MPYILVSTKLDIKGGGLNSDPELKNAALDALKRISDRYVHTDLKLTHLGFYRNPREEIKGLLVELSLEEATDKKAAFEKMKAASGL